ncbi:DUF7219 family protein [Nostoc sp.]|uniref:DUF7219 family protein n=1 Tax=Nostoc sp. TaxID=1180 RepID=UPI002FF5B336
MVESNKEDQDSFLSPCSRYYGEFRIENLIFNANLQEFTQKINYITSLEIAGKVTLEKAYKQIEALYKQLDKSKNTLNIGTNKGI